MVGAARAETPDPAAESPPVRFLPSQVEFIRDRLAEPVNEIYAVTTMLEMMLAADSDSATVTTILSHAVRTLLQTAEALQETIPSNECGSEVAS